MITYAVYQFIDAKSPTINLFEIENNGFNFHPRHNNFNQYFKELFLKGFFEPINNLFLKDFESTSEHLSQSSINSILSVFLTLVSF